jgi:hypothetical protein
MPIPFLGRDDMITHVVLVKLKDQSPKNIESVRALLSSLSGKIPSLRHFEVGADVTRSERSYELALIAKFDDSTGLKEYLTHPIHVPISSKLRELAANISVVDYESN